MEKFEAKDFCKAAFAGLAIYQMKKPNGVQNEAVGLQLALQFGLCALGIPQSESKEIVKEVMDNPTSPELIKTMLNNLTL